MQQILMPIIVDRSILNPDLFLKTNILGTAVLMDACREFGVTRFHQVSTDEVYGDIPLDRKDLRFTEDSLLKTSSPYSASKASADLLVMSYFRTYGLPVTISRCSNNYGPYQFPEKLIPRMIACAVKGQYLPVYGKRENVRDWLYVRDHCSAIEKILLYGTPGEVYNIGGNAELRNIDLVRMICHEMNCSEDRIRFVEDRKEHDLRYAIDASKICVELGWKPEVMIERGIPRTIRWYLENRGWWEPLLKEGVLPGS